MSLFLLRSLCLACVFAAGWLVARSLVSGPSPLGRYVASLDARLSAMQKPTRGATIAAGQGALLFASGLLAIRGVKPQVLLLCALATLIGPTLWLNRLQNKRRTEIERQLNSLTTALANALRASRSLGQGLERAREASTGPLAEELAIVLKELRLGATVDEAMLSMSKRAGSSALESVVCALLIGRQIGGRVPEILETTAESLREMERINGVIRTKTSEGKGQLAIMALAPPFIFFAFDRMQPGYFEPLTQSLAGIILLGGVVACWAASIVVARGILALEV